MRGRRELERETGVEPATSSLGSWHSTTELLPPRRFDYAAERGRLSATYYFLNITER
jgi:hypothetical protein